MKVTTKFREEKDGRIKLEWRFTAEGRRPRSERSYDGEADVCDMALSNLLMDTPGNCRIKEYDDRPKMIATREYVGPNSVGDHPDMDLLLRDDNGEGWPGNSDPSQCRYHGWRGTTNDWAVYAHGLRRVLDVRVTGDRSKRVVVVLGRDLANDNRKKHKYLPYRY